MQSFIGGILLEHRTLARASTITIEALKILKRARVHTKIKYNYCKRRQRRETVDGRGQAITRSGESSEDDFMFLY